MTIVTMALNSSSYYRFLLANYTVIAICRTQETATKSMSMDVLSQDTENVEGKSLNKAE